MTERLERSATKGLQWFITSRQPDILSKEHQSMINVSIVIEWLNIVLDWLNANSAAVTATAGVLSALATGGLVWLYNQQKNIQEKLVEVEHKPEIVREKIYLTQGETLKMINYVLKNVGNGPATDLRQRIHLQFEHEYILPRQVETTLERPGEEHYLLDRGKNYLESNKRLQFTAHYGGQCVEISEKAQEDLDNTTELELLKGDHNYSSL